MVIGIVAGLIELGRHRRHEANPGALATRVHFCRVQIGDAVDTDTASGDKRECAATLEWYDGLRGPAGWYRPGQLGD